MRKNIPGLLSIDKNFTPVSKDDGDELYPNGIFVFNITKMIEHLSKHRDKIAPEPIDVKKHRSSLASLNENHVDKTDLSIPIILAEIRPGWFNVIDGNHRIEKAFRMGMDYITGYKLKPKQHMMFLTSLEGYHSYVEYWNSKIRQDHHDRVKKHI